MEAKEKRSELRQEAPNASMATKVEAAKAIDRLRGLLEDYRNEGALEVSWEERGVDAIRDALTQTTMSTRELDRRGNPEEPVEVKVAAVMSYRELDRIGRELDDIAMELGFGPEPKSGSGDIYEVKRDPEDYDDPIKDDIPKPQ